MEIAAVALTLLESPGTLVDLLLLASHALLQVDEIGGASFPSEFALRRDERERGEDDRCDGDPCRSHSERPYAFVFGPFDFVVDHVEEAEPVRSAGAALRVAAPGGAEVEVSADAGGLAVA